MYFIVWVFITEFFTTQLVLAVLRDNFFVLSQEQSEEDKKLETLHAQEDDNQQNMLSMVRQYPPLASAANKYGFKFKIEKKNKYGQKVKRTQFFCFSNLSVYPHSLIHTLSHKVDAEEDSSEDSESDMEAEEESRAGGDDEQGFDVYLELEPELKHKLKRIVGGNSGMHDEEDLFPLLAPQWRTRTRRRSVLNK